MIERSASSVVWAGCAVVAGGLAAVSDLTPHRVWGVAAALGYGAAALLAGRPRVAAGAALLGAVAVPLVLLVAAGLGQSEVAVVERSGALLTAAGVPYAPEPDGLADYNPYLPGMALLGALPGDPRWWTGAVFAASVAAVRSSAGPAGRMVACPLVALPLAVGGVDLPVAGLVCLGLALAGRGRAGWAGLALGAAATLKWTAWPALPVAVALLAGAGRGAGRWTGSGSGRDVGRRVRSRGWVRCAAVAVGVAGAGVVPVALGDPGAFHEHVVAFPLGLTGTESPAASPFPGRLLAAYVPGGAVVAGVLLAGSALFIAASLLVRPPRTVPAAARRLALGLTLAIAFMPASRFGYLVVPFVLLTCLRETPCTVRSSSPTTSRPGRAASRRS
ncbi:glycosyltransferase 87 family protein [Streptomyces sp. CA-252508]|uniref:glycosyltransferase 87 family protein n=1 Tax=Streptomyces sp. CA-252508 TaxID=3418946 RepID=UPI003D8A306A